MPPEETIARRYVYQGRILNLRVDTVRLPSGRVTTREIVEHRGAVALVPLDEDGHVLMVRQYRKAIERDLLEIPAGTLEPGESPEACARRELAEETGYQADRLEPLLSFYSSPGFCTEQLHLYLARGLRPAAVPRPEDERLTLERVPLAQVPALISQGVICDAKSLIGLLALLAGLPTRPAPESERG